jgi:hypothetical protein
MKGLASIAVNSETVMKHLISMSNLISGNASCDGGPNRLFGDFANQKIR